MTEEQVPKELTDAIVGLAAASRADPTEFILAAMRQVLAQRADLVASQLETVNTRIDGSDAHCAEQIAALDRRHMAQLEMAKELLLQRVTAMDRASELLAADLRKVPSDLQLAIATLKELIEGNLRNISERFEILDRQTAREKAAADLALAAAFDAQKEASAATNQANSEAIRKSELATAKTIDGLSESLRSMTNNFNDKLEDLKAALVRAEQTIGTLQTQRTSQLEARTGHRESATDNRAIITLVIGFVAILMTMLLAGTALYGALKH